MAYFALQNGIQPQWVYKSLYYWIDDHLPIQVTYAQVSKFWPWHILYPADVPYFVQPTGPLFLRSTCLIVISMEPRMEFGTGKTNLRHSHIGFQGHIFLVLPGGCWPRVSTSTRQLDTCKALLGVICTEIVLAGHQLISQCLHFLQRMTVGSRNICL